jgi:hypothetical protein
LSLPTHTTGGYDIDASSSAHWYARTAGPLTPLTLADTDPVAPEAAHPLAVNVLDPNDGAGGAGGGVDWKYPWTSTISPGDPDLTHAETRPVDPILAIAVPVTFAVLAPLKFSTDASGRVTPSGNTVICPYPAGSTAVTDATTAETRGSLGTTSVEPFFTPRIGTDAVEPGAIGTACAFNPAGVEYTRVGVIGTK